MTKPQDLLDLSQQGNADRYLPLKLHLGDGSELTCYGIVRRVPGKRLVFRGAWQGHSVYAKVFIGNDKLRYAQRDAEGVNALTRAQLLTPTLLYQGSAMYQGMDLNQNQVSNQDQLSNQIPSSHNQAANDSQATSDAAAQVLIFLALAHSVNTLDAWLALPPHSQKQFKLASELVKTVAWHHQAGLMQTDLYLNNFLLRDEQVYTLDGDGIRVSKSGIARKDALRNLSVLLSKFDATDDSWIPELANIYAVERNLQFSQQEIEQLALDAASQRIDSARAYALHKVFRNCTDIEVTQDYRHFMAIARPYASQLSPMLVSPDALLGEQHTRLKSGNTCTVSLIVLDASKIAVKRYNLKNVLHACNRMFRRSRASLSWSNTHLLGMYGIAAAKPIALYERRFGPIRQQSYFFAEYIEAPDVAVFFADKQVSMEEKKVASIQIARLFYKLQLLKISHGDFKFSNMKIVENQPVLIDLDSMKQHRWEWLFERRHVRDLKRFFRNWQQDANTTELLKSAFRQVYSAIPSSQIAKRNLLAKAGLDV